MMIKNKKTIILTEEQKNAISENADELTSYDDILMESFVPYSRQVIILKNFLDKNFQRGIVDDIDELAKPIKKPIIKRVVMGDTVESLSGEDVVLLLMDEFPNMVKDKNDFKNFVRRVVTDWYDNKITENGILSVNYI